jgi:hypothetical protein
MGVQEAQAYVLMHGRLLQADCNAVGFDCLPSGLQSLVSVNTANRAQLAWAPEGYHDRACMCFRCMQHALSLH